MGLVLTFLDLLCKFNCVCVNVHIMFYPKIYVKLLNNVLTSHMNMTQTDNSKQADSFEKWLLCLKYRLGCERLCMDGIDAYTHSTGQCQLFDVYMSCGFLSLSDKLFYLLTAVESCDQVFGV